ncbi:hypothetical protein [Paenibacillus sp. 2TAB19]|uniref:hypothetical protein n=1 Tax=Paenibacillus sp. 2TAB19 TaxID=3233003 RepID=UPI003F96339B
MIRKLIYGLLFFFWIILINEPIITAQPDEYKAKEKDSIEWVALWTFPKTREEQLERMLTTELQRKVLWALQEKHYLEPGKEHLYSIDPFQVSTMRQNEHGISELEVTAKVHQVIDNEIEKKFDNYLISFRHKYDSGFMVIEVVKK